MNILKILIVDDTPHWSGSLVKRLTDPIKYKVDLRAEADGAVNLAKSDRFDVVFIDLDLSGPPNSNSKENEMPVLEGVDVCSHVRDLQKNALIVIYSGHIDPGAEDKFPHYERCISAGADEIISRTELLTLSAKELSENIAKWVQRKRESEKNKVNAHITYDSGIRTQALKEIFHEEVLESIIVQCAQEMNYFDVKALQAGYSGAAVFRIKASKDPNFSDGVYLVAKISRSNFSLEDELKRRPKPGSHFDATSAAPHSQPIIHSSGLYAIFIPEVRQMMILRDFLNQPLKNKDSAILNRVVQDLLVVPAKEAKPWKDFDVDDSAYQFKVSACSEVADFLSDAATWKTILEPRDLHAIKIVQQIVTLMIEKKWGFTVADRHAARLHGDFHCKNVFLAPGDGPVLIDFGRSDIYPRLFDFAALDTDLILSVMDSGKGGDHAYTNTEKWMRRVTKSFPFVQKKTPKQPNTRIELLRTTLLAQMTSKLKSVSPSEYGEVLIFHMLRYLRFQNIPSAKKILAVHIIAKLAKQLGLLQQI